MGNYDWRDSYFGVEYDDEAKTNVTVVIALFIIAAISVALIEIVYAITLMLLGLSWSEDIKMYEFAIEDLYLLMTIGVISLFTYMGKLASRAFYFEEEWSSKKFFLLAFCITVLPALVVRLFLYAYS